MKKIRERTLPDEKFRLSDDLIGPLLLVEVGSEGVSDGVGRDLVTPRVQILHLHTSWVVFMM